MRSESAARGREPDPTSDSCRGELSKGHLNQITSNVSLNVAIGIVHSICAVRVQGCYPPRKPRIATFEASLDTAHIIFTRGVFGIQTCCKNQKRTSVQRVAKQEALHWILQHATA